MFLRMYQSSVAFLSYRAVRLVSLWFEVMGYYDIGLMGIDWLQIGLEESLELFGVSIVDTGCVRHLATMLHDAGPGRRHPRS